MSAPTPRRWRVIVDHVQFRIPAHLQYPWGRRTVPTTATTVQHAVRRSRSTSTFKEEYWYSTFPLHRRPSYRCPSRRHHRPHCLHRPPPSSSPSSSYPVACCAICHCCRHRRAVVIITVVVVARCHCRYRHILSRCCLSRRRRRHRRHRCRRPSCRCHHR